MRGQRLRWLVAMAVLGLVSGVAGQARAGISLLVAPQGNLSTGFDNAQDYPNTIQYNVTQDAGFLPLHLAVSSFAGPGSLLSNYTGDAGYVSTSTSVGATKSFDLSVSGANTYPLPVGGWGSTSGDVTALVGTPAGWTNAASWSYEASGTLAAGDSIQIRFGVTITDIIYNGNYDLVNTGKSYTISQPGSFDVSWSGSSDLGPLQDAEIEIKSDAFVRIIRGANTDPGISSVHVDPGVGVNQVRIASVPEPSSVALGSIGAVVAFLAYGWSRHRPDQHRLEAD